MENQEVPVYDLPEIRRRIVRELVEMQRRFAGGNIQLHDAKHAFDKGGKTPQGVRSRVCREAMVLYKAEYKA
jgi:hypothetical protein